MKQQSAVSHAGSRFPGPSSSLKPQASSLLSLLLSLLVLLVAAAPASAQISISAVSGLESAWATDPALGGAVSQTATITGSFPFPAAMTATLSKAGSPDIVATNVGWVDPATVTATFDFTGADVGWWTDLEVTHSILGSATLTEQFVLVKPPPKLRRLSSWGGPVQEMVVVGNLGYVARGAGLVILDLTDPADMVELGSIDLAGLVHSLAVKDSYALLGIDEPRGMSIVDVSDPGNPTLVRAGIDLGRGFPFEIHLSGDGSAAYLDRGTSFRQAEIPVILDVTDPPSIVDSPTTFPIPGAGNIYTMTVSAGRLYIIDGSPELSIFDISVDPFAPVLLGTADLFSVGGYPTAVAVDGDFAYVTGWAGATVGTTARLTIVNVANPTAPFVNGGFTDLFKPMDVTVSAGIAYVADFTSKGMAVLDVSDPTTPTLLSTFRPGGGGLFPNSTGGGPPTRGVVLSGSTAYALDDGEGVVAVDLANPANPIHLGTWRSPAWPREMARVGDFLLFNDLWRGLNVLDVSDPRHPTLAGFLEGGQYNGRHGGVVAEDGILYSASGFNGIRIFDVSDPANPTPLAVWDPCLQPGVDCQNGIPPSAPYNVVVKDGILVVSIVNFGPSKVLDVSNPASPVLAASFPWGLQESWVISDDFVAYGARDVGCGGAIHDVSDPYSPVDFCPCPNVLCLGTGVALAVEGNRLYHLATNIMGTIQIYELLPDGTDSFLADFPFSVVLGDGLQVRDGLAYAVGAPGGSPPISPRGLSVFDVAQDVPHLIATKPAQSIGALFVDGRYAYAGTPTLIGGAGTGGQGLVIFQTAAAGDADGDFDTDLADYAAYQRCFGGEGIDPPEADCLVFDFDEDDDVDLDDLPALLMAWGQAGIFWASSDPAEFNAYVTAQGLTQTGFEDFEEANVAPGTSFTMRQPLDEFTDNGAFNPGDIAAGLRIESNVSQALGMEPSSPNHTSDSRLLVSGDGHDGSVTKTVRASDGFGEYGSMDLIFDPLADVRAVGLELIEFDPNGNFGVNPVHVMVFDTDNKFVRRFVIGGVDESGSFLGVWSGRPIGRINIWADAGLDGQTEGADNIQMWSTP